MMQPEKIAAVVVTHNRTALLLECVAALQAQTQVLGGIIIIDNAGKDNVSSLFAEKSEGCPIHVFRLPENIGGAGGFHEGIKKAHELGFEYVWLMDDDTEPMSDALEKLCSHVRKLPEIEQAKFGFVCSKIVWTDNSVHRMNLPQIAPLVGKRAFNDWEHIGLLRVNACSFVSVLVAISAVRTIGLPLKEMFIWGDDVEFFGRMVRAAYQGYYCAASEAKHKTVSNSNDGLLEQTPSQYWKSDYGIRNELYIIRSQKGSLKMFMRLLWRLSTFNFRILTSNNPHKWQICRINTRASLRSLFFKPAIQKLN